MSKIDLDISLIKAILVKNLRVGLFFKNDDIIVEYHFTKDPRSLPDTNDLDSITCVMCSSTNGDALKLTGTTIDIERFTKILNKKGNGKYDLFEAKVFPLDWYPCFETKGEARIAKVAKIIPTLTSTIEEIKRIDRIRDEEKRIIMEEEEKRFEEAMRRNLEAMRIRNEARIQKGSAISSQAIRYDTGKILPGYLGPNGKF